VRPGSARLGAQRSWPERALALLIDRAKWVAAALVVLTGLALWQATHLRVEVDLSGLIGPQTAGAEGIRDYSRRFAPVRAEEVLLVTAPTLASDAALSALEDLLLDIQFIDRVEGVISLFSLPAPGRAGSWLAGPELADMPAGERLETLRRSDPLAGQLLSADLTGTVIVVSPASGAGGPGFVRDLMQAAQRSELSVQPIGLAAVQRAVAGELIRDLAVLTPSAVVICLVFSLILFRGWRAVVVCTLPPVVGLVWFGGWMGAVGIAIDPVMGALPVVLIVLAFSDSLHIWHAALHSRADLPRAVAETAPAAILTTITTIIAFASLALPDSPSLNRMALTGSVGMALTLCAVLLLTPVLMALLRAPAPGTTVPRAFAAVVPPALATLRAWRWSPLVAVVVMAALLAGQSQSRPGFRYADYLPTDAPVTAALAQAEALGLGSDRLLVVVEAVPPGSDTTARAAALAVWGPESAAWLDGPQGAEMLGRMRSADGSAHALPVQVPISAAGAAADVGARAIEARLEAAGLGEHARVVGPGFALVTEGPRLVEGLRTGLYLTIVAVTVLIGVVHRSARIAAAAVVPSLIPILGVEVWLVATGRELTIMNMIALTVAFGIAVDDTLHFLNRFRLAPGHDLDTRLRQAVEAAGPPMAATTLVLLAGLLVTLTSTLPGLAIFGFLIALAVLLALVSDLFLLPALLRWSLR
jgi:uncharacterized protein